MDDVALKESFQWYLNGFQKASETLADTKSKQLTFNDWYLEELASEE